jgi:hypothetical protein
MVNRVFFKHTIRGRNMIFVGGLYKEQEQAVSAYYALREAGFPEDNITVLERKQGNELETERRTSARDVARSAGLGALLLGFVGAILVLLIGVGMLPIPAFLPNLEPGATGMTLGLAVITFFISAVTGAILGAAFKLSFSADKEEEIAEKDVKGGDILIVVNVDESKQTKAQSVMQDSEIVDVENLTEKWDPDIWSRYKGGDILLG